MKTLCRFGCWIAAGISFFTAFGHAAPLQFKFSLSRPAYVTLVLDDSSGIRIRNLLSETELSAGAHAVVWDTVGDRVTVDGTTTGVIETRTIVKPGKCTLRGLVRDRIDLRYEFTVYNSGTPPWETANGKGQWLADHSPPQSVFYDPVADEVIISAPANESSNAIAFVGSDGKKKGEIRNLANFKGAPNVTVDRITNVAYAAYITDKTELVRLLRDGSSYAFRRFGSVAGKLTGMAARDNRIYVSIKENNQIMVVDTLAQIKNIIPVTAPKGIFFDATGRLLVLTNGKLVRYAFTDGISGLPVELIGSGLDDAAELTQSDSGEIFISLKGAFNQVHVFDSTGQKLREIGVAGTVVPGPYNPLHMRYPHGIAVDRHLRVWIAENSYMPKRVGVWDLQGKLLNEYLGATKYGGGGIIDPYNPNRFYYAEDYGRGSMEFELDWEKGTSKVKNLLQIYGGIIAQVPLYHDSVLYLTNEQIHYPTKEPDFLVFFIEKNGTLVRAATISNPDTSMSGLGPWSSSTLSNYVVSWCDKNGDLIRQTDEISWIAIPGGDIKCISTNKNMEVTFALQNSIYRVALSGVAPGGQPMYDMQKAKKVASVGGRALSGTDGSVVLRGNPLKGVADSSTRWTYPNPWPDVKMYGVGGGPRFGGEMIGGTIFLNTTLKPKQSDIGELFAVNGNLGTIYLLSTDGLFVATLFKDARIAAKPYPTMPAGIGTGRGGWHMPEAIRGMLLNGVSNGEEAFWPSLTQLADGKIYCVAGHEHNSIVSIQGLETVRRFSMGEVAITEAALKDGAVYDLQMIIDNPQSAFPPKAPRFAAGGIRLSSSRRIVYVNALPHRGELVILRANGSSVFRAAVKAQTKITVDAGRITPGVYYYQFRDIGGRLSNSGKIAVCR